MNFREILGIIIVLQNIQNINIYIPRIFKAYLFNKYLILLINGEIDLNIFKSMLHFILIFIVVP